MRKTLFSLTAILLIAPSLFAQSTVTPNLQLQIPSFQQTNWQVPINYDMNALDGILAGTQSLPTGATPLISQQANWLTANPISTTITNFVGGLPGQTLRIFCGDALTLITGSANISVSSIWSCSSSQSITLVLLNAVWIEVARSGGSPSGAGTPCTFLPNSLQWNNSGTFGCITGSFIGPDGSLDKLIMNNSATGGAVLQVGTGVGGTGGTLEICYTTTLCPPIAGAPFGIVLQEGVLNGQINWVDNSSGYDILGVDTNNNLNWNNGKVLWSKIGFEDNVLQANPGNPPSGRNRLYMDSTSGLMTCLTSSGTSCLASNPGGSNSALQYNNAGSFGGAVFSYSASAISAVVDSSINLTSTDGTNSMTMAVHSAASGLGSGLFVISSSAIPPYIISMGVETLIGGTTLINPGGCFTGSQAPCGVGISSLSGPIASDSHTNLDVIGFRPVALLPRGAGHSVNNVAGFVVGTPANGFAYPSPAPLETANNVYGLVVLDQLGVGTVDTAGIRIESQTSPHSGTLYAIQADTGAGISSFGDGIRAGGVIVSALPSAASNPGLMMYVTDSTAIATEGQTCVGSSTNKALAFSNGTAWKCF